MAEQTPISTSNARLCAFGALVHVLEKNKPLNAAWAADRHFSALSPSDRAFAQLMAKTVLRRLGQIDDLLARFLDQPTPPPPRIMHSLRLGVAQLIWLHTPPHAAVHSAVEMTRQLKLDKFGGLVNAVLKRIAQEGPAIAETQDAARLNTPGWLWESWEKAYGEPATRQIAEMHLKEPPIDITVKNNPEHWAAELSGVVLPTGSVRLKHARNLTQLPGFSAGDWWVQDMAASIPARLLGNVQGKRVIDLCAAADGKTAQLASAGAQVSAVGVSRERIAMLKTSVHRLRLQADYVTTDASRFLPAFAPDALLLDAPCSLTGTLRRHPDITHQRKPADMPAFVQAQHRLLRHALDILKPGGILVYSVCSLQPEEAEDRIDALLAERPDAGLIPIETSNLPGLEPCITPRGELRTLPFHLSELDGMDGFYAAKIQKTA